jgi:hypothetical protein
MECNLGVGRLNAGGLCRHEKVRTHSDSDDQFEGHKYELSNVETDNIFMEIECYLSNRPIVI